MSDKFIGTPIKTATRLHMAILTVNCILSVTLMGVITWNFPKRALFICFSTLLFNVIVVSTVIMRSSTQNPKQNGI